MKTQISVLISKAALLFMIVSASVLMPFNIYADTLPQSEIVGVTYNKIDETVSYLNGSGTWVYVYEIEVLLRNKYVGVVDGTLSYSYSEQPSGQTITTSKRTYVNGDSFKLNVSITQFGSSYSGSAPMYSASFLVNAQNTNVTKYEDLTSIDSIISLLQDIYTNSSDIENLSTNQLLELEKIVQNTSLANDYLKIISDFRMWNIPIESINFITNFYNRNFDLLDYSVYNNYPIFIVPDNSYIYNEFQYAGTYNIIFLISGNINANTQSEWIKINNVSFSNIQKQTLSGVATQINGLNAYFMKLTYTLASAQRSTIQLINSNYPGVNLYVLPIYLGRADNKLVSTDFALQWGLSNLLLDDLHIIANGTNQSNQQSQDLSSGTDSMQDQMDDLVGIEDSYNQQFNNSVNSIDFSNPLQQNQGLLGASNFVITVFNGLIANNPFSILIIIVCILLIGKKVIGK